MRGPPARTPQFPDETDERGAFQRQASVFREWVSTDGSTAFPVEARRYHLVVTYACPWAHRAIIVRMLKRLEDVISLSVVNPVRDERGWGFGEPAGAARDGVTGAAFLREAYERTLRGTRGRITVPVLWDRVSERVVNNESAEVIRMLNGPFATLAPEATPDLVPDHLRDEIDATNAFVYEFINNGVYRCGFATTQAVYDEAFRALFAALDDVDARLSERRYLVADVPTEADWRLFTTLVRFDVVYVGHFKCNARRIADYPNLSGYLRDLYQQPGIAETVRFDDIKRHYYLTHHRLNPSGVVPNGPLLDLDAPHGRA